MLTKVLSGMDTEFLVNLAQEYLQNKRECMNEIHAMIDEKSPPLKGFISFTQEVLGGSTAVGACIILWIIKRFREDWLSEIMVSLDDSFCLSQGESLVDATNAFMSQARRMVDDAPLIKSMLRGLSEVHEWDITIVNGVLVILKLLRMADDAKDSSDTPPEFLGNDLRSHW